MTRRKIPVFAVCGTHAAGRKAFYDRFCKAQHPLRVVIQRVDATPDSQPDACAIQPPDTPQEAGLRITACLQEGTYDAVWVDWTDEAPIRQLIDILRTDALYACCRLRTVVRCVAGPMDIAALTDGDGSLYGQVAQCDLLAVDGADSAAIRRLRRRLLPLQPNLEAIPLDNPREILAVLSGRSPLEAIRFGVVAAVCAAVLLLLNRFQYSIPDTLSVFLGTYLQALPFLLLGILLSSAIQVFVPGDLLQRIFPKNLPGGMLFGVLGGFILPICDCASIPVFRSLVRKGVPLPAAVTFMISAPIINPVVLLSTYYAFGGSVPLTLARMGFGIVCSVLIGLLFTRDRTSVFKANGTVACACGHAHDMQESPAGHGFVHAHAGGHEHESGPAQADTGKREHAHGPACACGHAHAHAHDHDTRAITEDADGCAEPVACCAHTHAADAPAQAKRSARGLARARASSLVTHFRAEFFEVARYLLIGISVSTVLQMVLGNRLQAMQFDNMAIGMLAMMLLAFLLSLCSSSDAVVAKNIGAALPMGAVMVFLVFGPMMDIKNLILLSAGFTRRFIVKLLAATAIVSFAVVYLAFALGLGGLL